MRTQFSSLTTSELIRYHRFDAPSNALVEELWARLESLAPEDPPVKTKYAKELFRYGANP